MIPTKATCAKVKMIIERQSKNNDLKNTCKIIHFRDKIVEINYFAINWHQDISGNC